MTGYDWADNAKGCYDEAIAALRIEKVRAGECLPRPDLPEEIEASPLVKDARQIGERTLYCGDCLEVLPLLPEVDAVICDPPYVGLKGGFEHYQSNNLAKNRIKSMAVGDMWGASLQWLPECRRIAKRYIASFCGYSDVATLKSASDLEGWLITWAFDNSMPSLRNAPWFKNEFIWLLRTGTATWRGIPTVIHVPKLNAGCAGSPERLRKPDGAAAHPTQKPISVVSNLIVPEAQTILDPFMGSGTTGVACVKLGRRFIGIEIDPGYFEIACKRIADAYAQPDMLVEAERQTWTQTDLLKGA